MRARKIRICCLLLMLMACLLSFRISAEIIVIPISDIVQLEPGSSESPANAINTYLVKKLSDEFDQLGFNTSEGLVLNDIPVEAITQQLVSDCPLPMPYEVHVDATTARVTLDSNSSLSFDLDSIKNITTSINLSGRLDVVAGAWVRWGVDIFGSDCRKFETDHGQIGLSVPFNLTLTLVLTLNPQYDSEQVAIIVDKQAVIMGQPNIGQGNINADFGNWSITDDLIDAFENNLLDKLKTNAEQAFHQKVVELNHRLNGLDANGYPDPTITAFNAPTVFILEDNSQDKARLRALLERFGIPELVLSLVNEQGIEILMQLAVLNPEQRDAYLARLGADVGCEALRNTWEIALPTTPLYTLEAQGCVVADVFGADTGQYYNDAACSVATAFRPTDVTEFCQLLGSNEARTLLGNAAAWTADVDQANDPLPGIQSRAWTATPSTQMNMTVVSIEGNYQPYMKQIQYKTISGLPRGTGTCKLEMRAYKKDIGAQQLKPMIVIHGGTWQHRGFGFYGLEASISHLTERGFIVFAPFYRLAGDSDGNPECNGATWREITVDVEDALQWVTDNGVALGATDEPVTVFGQSAGAHLAAWLAAYRPVKVRKALLFYGPTDVLELLSSAVPLGGPYADFRDASLKSLATVYGATNGATEIRLGMINYAGLTPALLQNDWQTLIPDGVFDLSKINSMSPPAYLARCAQLTQSDLSQINLAQPPASLMDCLKQDLSEFLVANSFNAPLGDEAVPLFMIHGTADTLVPYAQAVNLCSAIDNSVLPINVIDDLTRYECGNASQAHIIKDAEHVLDLKLCVSPVCPAGALGSPSRAAVTTAVASGYDWLTQEQEKDAPGSNKTPAADNGGGGYILSRGGEFDPLWILILVAASIVILRGVIVKGSF